MKKKQIQTTQAPSAIGPYSQAIRIGEVLYTSGQIALNPENMEMMSCAIEEETEWVLKNLEAILKADGMSFAHIEVVEGKKPQTYTCLSCQKFLWLDEEE